VLLSAEDRPETVVVRMGAPRFAPHALPFLSPTTDTEAAIEVPLEGFALTAVSMGNPHAVIFTTEDPHELARQRGPALEVHTRFPERCNIEFAKHIGDRRFAVGVWERGCGITLACGTGACATAAAAVRTGRAALGEELEIKLLGGSLWIQVAADFSEIFMRGEAREVFAGTFDVFSLQTPPPLQ
jgi:diaminopimelate epimerase